VTHNQNILKQDVNKFEKEILLEEKMKEKEKNAIIP